MNIFKKSFELSSLMWKFLGFFQTPFLRIWHCLAILFVLVQLLMFWYLLSEGHVDRGLLLVPFICIFLFVSFKRRGVKFFFSYLWGDISQLKKDIHLYKQGLAIAPRSGGLPGLIQGLGLLFFFVTVFSGFCLYLSYEHAFDFSFDFYALHSHAALALFFYFVIHAYISIRHFLFWKRAQDARK